MRRYTPTAVATLAAVLLTLPLALGQSAAVPVPPAKAPAGIEAITKPSSDVKLSFVRPGAVTKVLVKEGQIVKGGDLLMQQDDLAEQVALQQQKAKAQSDQEVRAAKADLAQKKVDLAKYQDAFDRKTGIITPMELEHAKLEVTIGELKVEAQEFQRKMDVLEVEKLQKQIDRLQIRSSIDGRVEEVFIKQGELAQEGAKAVRVVNIDPLYVDVPVNKDKISPTLAQDTSNGTDVYWTVTFQGRPAVKAKIRHVGAVIEPASQTQLVRLEVPNPSLRAAGEHVIVEITPATNADQKSVAASVNQEPKKAN